MERYQYLIVGGGMTAAAAVGGIRQVDPQGTIGVIGSELHLPYKRPLLSKGLWAGKPLEKIWIAGEFPGVEYHTGQTIGRIDPSDHCVVDSQGQSYGYERLLLATGGTPIRLPVESDAIIYFRTLDDYQRLHDIPDENARVVVIGGGFIGSEIAASLAMNGRRVAMVFPEAGIGARVFPDELAKFLNHYYTEKGVDVRAGALVKGLEQRDDQIYVTTDQGGELQADQVVAGIGIRPNVELAKAAGLDINNGIVVDEFLHTSLPDIFAAGDVASFYNPSLGKRMRVEHEDNANTMGRIAGYNMAGEKIPYEHLPFFYSDLFDLGYEAVGELDPSLEVIQDWQEPNRKGVVYYLGDNRVRGVLLWNVWDQVENARQLVADPGPWNREKVLGRLPK